MSTGLRDRSAVTAAPVGGGTHPAGRRSAIYEGWVFHRRTEPVEHTFRYRIFMPLVDLDELPALFERSRLWSADRRAPARFQRSDYLRGHGDGQALSEGDAHAASSTGWRSSSRSPPRHCAGSGRSISAHPGPRPPRASETRSADQAPSSWKPQRQ